MERPAISIAIGEARELGDLSENFEYHSAKDKQGLIEAKIRDVEDKVSRAQVIDPLSLSGERVVFGATVTIEEVESGDEQIYQIVGETEGNLELNRISVISPVARALIGREIGDEVKLLAELVHGSLKSLTLSLNKPSYSFPQTADSAGWSCECHCRPS